MGALWRCVTSAANQTARSARRRLVGVVALYVVAGMTSINNDGAFAWPLVQSGSSVVCVTCVPVTKSGESSHSVPNIIINNSPDEYFFSISADLGRWEHARTALSQGCSRMDNASDRFRVENYRQGSRSVIADLHVAIHKHVPGRKPAHVSYFYNPDPIFSIYQIVDAGRFDADVSPKFQRGIAYQQFVGFLGQFGGIASGVSGSPGIDESTPQKKYSDDREGNTRERREGRPQSPPRHLLLGAKITISAVFFFGGFWLIYTGFQRAGDALDLVLDGFGRHWGLVGLWGVLTFAGVSAVAGVVTYWLSVYGPS
jgi:hypothetical protein